MSALERCPRCGSSLDATSPCGSCLLDAATARPEAPDLVGERLGPYAIGRVLGQGGMGVVYEAVDTQLERMVAIKILAAELEASDLLVREAQILAALEHKHIVPVYEVGEHEGIAYFSMKRIDGGPLTAPAPSPRRAAEIAQAIARAVGFAHQHGILHRDLKPQNVLIEAKTGRPFVTDFGLAAHSGLAVAPGGTPEYMAPEVWRREPGAAAIAADVWGMGAILYELLRGRPPFHASPSTGLRQRVTEEDPPALVGVPEDLAAVCLHCLEKDPARRYATADELADELQRFLDGAPVLARPLGRSARALRIAKRHPAITALTIAIAALTGLLAVTAALAVINALSLARAREATFHGADVTARSLARLTALQFDRYKTMVEAAGRDPRVALALADPAADRATSECERLLAGPLNPSTGPFATWFLLDETGKMIGHAPLRIRNLIGRSFHFRDYFRGVQEQERAHLRAAYVSRVFRSESDDDYEIAIAIAVHDASDRWVGLLAATIPTGAAFASIELEDPGDANFTAALLTPRGLERGQTEASPDLVFLQHRALGRGEMLSAGLGDVLGMDADKSGLMRLVPVRGTPFSVLVHVAYDGPLTAASSPLRR